MTPEGFVLSSSIFYTIKLSMPYINLYLAFSIWHMFFFEQVLIKKGEKNKTKQNCTENLYV